MLPLERARRRAIRARRFYVLTHPEHNPRLQERAAAIIEGRPPPVLTPG